jgi:acylpyruvate hydrolase
MKLVTYSWQGYDALGALSKDRVVDLHRAHRARLMQARDWDELAVADLRVPSSPLGLLQGGSKSMTAAREALTFVERHAVERHAVERHAVERHAVERHAVERHAANGPAGLSHGVSDVKLLPPIQRPGKLVCVGLNYRSHLAEIGEAVPKYPILFHKAATSIIGDGESIVLPRISGQVDYEGELAVVIGRRCKYVPEKEALSYVAGYTCANDVSAHDLEFRTSQWTSGKMLDTFCPLGPVLLTADEVRDPGSLRLTTILNGQKVQDERLTDMVFSVPFLVSYVSSLATLEPGDVILTGTPAGIGCNRNPQVFLRAGDRIGVQIDGIGTLTNPVVAEEGR